MRIRLDRLPVAEENNRQQDDNGEADGHDVLHAQQAQRNQQRQRSFRSIRRRAQCVEPEDRDPGQRPNALGALRGSRQRPPKQQIEKTCVNAHAGLNRRLWTYCGECRRCQCLTARHAQFRASQTIPAPLNLPSVLSRCRRQRKQESASLAHFALRPDAAAVLLHNAAAQRQPQPGSAQRARV